MNNPFYFVVKPGDYTENKKVSTNGWATRVPGDDFLVLAPSISVGQQKRVCAWTWHPDSL
jgi:hypothetical protein